MTKIKNIVTFFLLTSFSLVTSSCSSERNRVAVIEPNGESEITLMEFNEPLTLKELPPGWDHVTFRFHKPMDISFSRKNGKNAVKLSTQNTASMLFRQVDIPINDYPVLSWDWLIEKKIDIAYDETTRQGDDHPARIYMTFEDPNGKRKSLQLVWAGKQLKPGDYKQLTYLHDLIGPYTHYVVRNDEDKIDAWHHERVNLREIYKNGIGDPTDISLVEIALFCDTDQTDNSSIAYFGAIKVHRS